uniref:Uncharacterized protein n=1 Tax=viral metagenome TaxID=1070528 RepID=A0A6C0EK90_9ZZZZ
MLNEETVTFGKYKDLSLDKMLRDRKYCDWLIKQDWFCKQYEYLYNRVQEHNPQRFFFSEEIPEIKETFIPVDDFLSQYKYFQLLPLKEIKINLTENEKKCYKFYRKMIKGLKEKIVDNAGPNPYNIKAPNSWLKKFETKYELSRDMFKEFLTAHDLPNLPYIVEDIKRMGGIDYKGARSYIIAKEKSVKQEGFWEQKLKEKYGEDIGTQFKFQKCIFDFIRIKTNTLYECKLGLKDFNEDQHNKYLVTLGSYSMVYLIDRDCVVDIEKKTIFTTKPEKYRNYLLSATGKFDNLIRDYNTEHVDCIEDCI